FENHTAAISVKTRLGRSSPEEFPPLLELFNRYPIHELTVHCRVGEDFYKKSARPSEFAFAYQESRAPVCYNGDLFTARDVTALAECYPQTPALMLGRGAVADPALFRRLLGGEGPTRKELQEYTADLFESYSAGFGSPRSALGRMKEIWFYLSCLFEEVQPYMKKLRKTIDPAEYRALVGHILGECPLRPNGPAARWQDTGTDLQ
ncbi:MAG: tRNA-dihydrouridine synthase, partial [Oscillospiraceae bacterium]|nr:tRNA-dihydrouridine synthase [Oscillospiraceae bacterium]